MFFDIHIHENLFSSDSHLNPIQILEEAKEAGLDGLCITDHESNDFKNYVAQYTENYDLKIIVGAEILTQEGDILVFGLDDLPTEVIPARELLTAVNKAGGVGIAAHPFRNNNRGLENNIADLAPLLHGIEALNGSTSSANNYRAIEAGLANTLSLLGGSDAHYPGRIGKFITEIEAEIDKEKDFIEAIKNDRVQPLYREAGEYLPVLKRPHGAEVI